MILFRKFLGQDFPGIAFLKKTKKSVLKTPYQITIEKANTKDADAIVEIDRNSFTVPWSRRMVLAELEGHDFSHALVARVRDVSNERPRIVGYIFFWSVADEIHIINIAVDPPYREKGIGRKLVERALDFGRKAQAHHAFLEVRVSNLNAQHLYARLGFKVMGIRRGYYTDNREDALVMRYLY
jgi:ribosomal-protein-alanine N-acetyltransferase